MNWQLVLFLLIVMVVLFLVKYFTKTYTMSVSEFKSLFNGMNDSRLTEVTAVGPFETPYTYMAYPIDRIECYDKAQHRVAIKNSPALEVQFTNRQGEKKSVYFDTIRINGTVITGSPSRFATKFESVIDLNDIEEIELSKAKRGFRYKQT